MTEKYQPISRKNWGTIMSIVLWEAMVRESKPEDMAQKYGIECPTPKGKELEVEVDFRVNGVPLNFKKTVEELGARMESRFDEEVLKKAKELVNLTRFERLSEIINNAEYQIEQEIERVFNEQKGA
jgi:hypothetical protein